MFDNHPLTIIAADGTAVEPVTLDYFQISPAERVSQRPLITTERPLTWLSRLSQYDFILNTNQGSAGSTFWGRFTQCMLSVQWIQPNYMYDHRAILKYMSPSTAIPAPQPSTAAGQPLPTTSVWPSLDIASETECHDMNLRQLKPILYKGAPVVPKTVLAHKVWVSSMVNPCPK